MRSIARSIRPVLVQQQARAAIAAQRAVTQLTLRSATHTTISAAFHSHSYVAHSAAAAPDTATAAAAPSSLIDASSMFSGPAPEHLSLQYDSSLSVLHVRMQRPALHNAFNEDLIAQLRHVFDGVAAAAQSENDASPLTQLRAVVLTGAGASFSAGADLNWMQKMRTYTKEENLHDAELLFQMIASISACPVPVVARVNGAALGGGVGLVAACDIAFSVDSAKFGLTEVKLGLSPAVISSFVMGKLSPAASSYYFLTGERFDAEEAKRIGLVHKVLADETQLDQAVQKLVEELALNSPKAVRATKELVNRVSRPRIAESEAYVTNLISNLRVSPEGQEGLSAFFEKRKPKWIPAHLGNPKPKPAKK